MENINNNSEESIELELDFLNNTEYTFDDVIINLIQNDIVPSLYQYDDTIQDFYKYMIQKLLIRGYNYEQIYNGIGCYQIYIAEIDEMDIVREQIRNISRNQSNRNINNLVSLFFTFLNNNNNDINEDNLEPVKLIVPKEELSKIPCLKYNDIDIDIKNNNNMCTICQSIFKKVNKVRLLKCKHIYHQKCIDKWLSEISHKCPICRVENDVYIAQT